MAQMIWQNLGAGQWEALSAGSKPSGYVHPMALKALEEIGLPIDGLESKSLDRFVDQPIDLVVTVCDDAKQACPALPGAKQRLHWPFEDPADAVGSEEERMETFSERGSSINKKKKKKWERFGQNQGFIFLRESCNLSKPKKDVGQQKTCW